MKKDMSKIKVMENTLETNLLKYNQIQSMNRALRAEIDVMRKEQRNQLRVNRTLLRDI